MITLNQLWDLEKSQYLWTSQILSLCDIQVPFEVAHSPWYNEATEAILSPQSGTQNKNQLRTDANPDCINLE